MKCLKYAIIFCLLSCEKQLDAGLPTDKVVAPAVYNNDANATDVLNGLYYTMSAGGPFCGDRGISFLGGLLADEFTLLMPDELWSSLYRNAVTPAEVPFWSDLYKYIYITNTAIAGLTPATKLTPAVRSQLLGEALFIRAYCYFYLVNLFGDVPYLTQTDYKINIVQPRTAAQDIYTHIIADLQSARRLLSNNYLDGDAFTPTADRYRPTSWAAGAMLARTYLYMGQWNAAALMADTILANKDQYALVALNRVFRPGNKEAIWQLENVTDYSMDGMLFSGMRPVEVKVTFEEGDNRSKEWLDNDHIPIKNPLDNNHCVTLLRLGELYLIRAEARARFGDWLNARADLNIVRRRAGLANSASKTVSDVLAEIWKERQAELFAEGGNRWLDLKRNGKLDSVMALAVKEKGGTWAGYKRWLPIPAGDRQLNKNLGQNEGY